MAPLKLGINGFGRVGKLIFRAVVENYHGIIQIVGVNDPNLTADYFLYSLQYDSVHQKFNGTLEKVSDDVVKVNDIEVHISREKEPESINWDKLQAQIVAECTGLIRTSELAEGHLKSGAKKVIISAQTDDNTPTYVYGVNHQKYKSNENIISTSSETTNCLAPLIKIINDKWEIVEGLTTTVHSMNKSENVVDGVPKNKKKWRSGRAASVNIIPSTCWATKGLEKILPELKGKIGGNAIKVPVVNVSLVDLNVRLEKSTSYDDICQTIKEASQTSELKGILGYTEDEIVSSDIVHDSRSAIFDANAGIELNDKFHKIVAWYDNEWGYCNRLLDMALYIRENSGL